MPSVRASAIICGALFALIVAEAVVGSLMPEAQRSLPSVRLALRVMFFTLVGAFTVSVIPFMVNAAFAAQPALRDQPRAGRVAIIRLLWVLMGLGAVVAIPAAIFFGAFGDVTGALAKRAVAHSHGTLVAGIGMSIPEVRRASTFELTSEAGRYTTVGDSGVFDFQVAGTQTVFRSCRFYFITLDERTRRIETVHVSIVPEKMRGPELLRFLTKTRAQLRLTGWRPGAYDRFTRGVMKLDLGRARMDEWRSGEARDAGEWIATIDLWPLKQGP